MQQILIFRFSYGFLCHILDV